MRATHMLIAGFAAALVLMSFGLAFCGFEPGLAPAARCIPAYNLRMQANRYPRWVFSLLTAIVLCLSSIQAWGQSGMLMSPNRAVPVFENNVLRLINQEHSVLDFNPSRVWSTKKLEDIIGDAIVEDYREDGKIDWGRLEAEFLAISDRASIMVLKGGGKEGADTYRFTLDRSNNWWAVFRTRGPGRANGSFTAIISKVDNDKVAIVRMGGGREWLKFEQSERLRFLASAFLSSICIWFMSMTTSKSSSSGTPTPTPTQRAKSP